MSDLVSIIIPAYNAEQYIEEAIRSSLEQTYEAIEVIVVDDGSEDDTVGRAKEFESERLRVVSQTNAGAGRARNRGLELANGRFVKFLDADDALVPTAIERQVAEATRQPDAIVFGKMLRCDEGLDPVGEAVYAQMGHSPEWVRDAASSSRTDVVASLLRWTPQTSCPLHYRRNLEAIGGFNESLGSGQEYDLHLRLALNGNRFVPINDTIVRVREHQSPHRITVAKTYHSYASKYRSDKLMYWATLIEAGFEWGIPAPVRVALAEMAWRHFRAAHAANEDVVADEALHLAMQLDPKIEGSPGRAFRFAARIIGPEKANRAAVLVRRVTTTWRKRR
jgi:glycosyltransferase involved in cell wall biosynthesis